MKIKKTLIKLIAFGIIIFFLILILKKVSPIEYSSDITDEISRIKDSSFLFIGSSRVQKSINPKILREHFQNKNIYNLGVSGSTFLSNCIFADFLMKKSAPKILFIELSPIIPDLPSEFIDFSSKENIHLLCSIEKLTKKESFRKRLILKLDIINHYFFKKILLKENLKKILRFNVNNKEKLAGFVSSAENNYNSITPFLRYKELNSYKTNNDLSSYHNYINHLFKSGNQHNTKIVFFLPITYNKKAEKDIVIPIYNSLPDSSKIKYSKEFISSIINPAFLSDSNHLNGLGAEKYTTMLLPYLENYFTGKKK